MYFLCFNSLFVKYIISLKTVSYKISFFEEIITEKRNIDKLIQIKLYWYLKSKFKAIITNGNIHIIQ